MLLMLLHELHACFTCTRLMLLMLQLSVRESPHRSLQPCPPQNSRLHRPLESYR